MLRIVSLWSHVPIHTIVSLKLDFEPQKKGGMAVSAVWRLAYLLKLTSELDWLGEQPPAARKSAKPRCEG